MHIIVGLLLAISVNAGPDQSVRFARPPSYQAPGIVQLHGIVDGGKAFQWQFPYPQDTSRLRLEDSKNLTPRLFIFESLLPQHIRIWLVASDGKQIVTDEVIITIE